ncbi:MAG: hypothetical protein GEV07_18740 [Streptosporangiales bacterium]|nr:hypothetical protein [Streptosporangiales bacterium]
MGSKLRWTIPVGIAAAAVAASAVVPALTAGADAALPAVSAQQLLSRTLASDVDTFSGTVRTEADLGIPALPQSVRSSDLSSLLTGTGTMRVAKSGADKQRLSVLGSNSERTYLRDGRTAWMYDSAERKAVRTTLPQRDDRQRHEQASPDQAAKRILAELGDDSDVSVGRAGEVAGRDAYELVVEPKSAESLVGSVQVSIDAKTWMPLGLTVLPDGSADPAIDVAFSELSYAEPAADTFEFDPPKGTKVERRTAQAGDHDRKPKQARKHGHHGEPSWTKVVELGDRGSKPTGEASAYLKQLRAAGTRVTGEYGSGTMIRSRLVTLLVLDDGRMFAGAVTPSAVERAAANA